MHGTTSKVHNSAQRYSPVETNPKTPLSSRSSPPQPVARTSARSSLASPRMSMTGGSNAGETTLAPSRTAALGSRYCASWRRVRSCWSCCGALMRLSNSAREAEEGQRRARRREGRERPSGRTFRLQLLATLQEGLLERRLDDEDLQEDGLGLPASEEAARSQSGSCEAGETGEKRRTHPRRCARLDAWTSRSGFHTGSRKIILVAAVSVMPRPPSLASTRMAWHSDADVWLNRCAIAPRSPVRV